MSIKTVLSGEVNWDNLGKISSHSYKCGYCERDISSNVGYHASKVEGTNRSFFGNIYICHYCGKPSFILAGINHPGASFGNPVQHIEHPEVNTLYDEARSCMKVNAYTSAVMCCRKLLMNIAVSEGAKKGESFTYYVDYLANENHVPKRAKDMLDAIRNLGNEANHEIYPKSATEAELAIKFVEMILKFMYEFPIDVKNLSSTPE